MTEEGQDVTKARGKPARLNTIIEEFVHLTRDLSLREAAEASGLSTASIKRLRDGDYGNLHPATTRAITKYLLTAEYGFFLAEVGTDRKHADPFAEGAAMVIAEVRHLLETLERRIGPRGDLRGQPDLSISPQVTPELARQILALVPAAKAALQQTGDLPQAAEERGEGAPPIRTEESDPIAPERKHGTR